jgi:phage-related protein
MPVPREVYMFKNYFLQFYHEQQPEVRAKIKWVLNILRDVDLISEKYLKHIRDGVFEVRAGLGKNIFRIFCCFEEGNIIVLFHGFQKKTAQTPSREIEKALRIHKEYREAKTKGEIANFLGRTP